MNDLKLIGKESNFTGKIFDLSRRVLLNISVLFLCISGIFAQKPGDRVLSIYVDEFDHQWFGTDNGLLRKCREVWKAYNIKPGYPGIINDIRHQNIKDPELWLGTTRGVVKVVYSSLNISSSVVYDSSITSFHSDIINSITFDDKNIGYFTTPIGIGIFAKAIWRFYTRLIDIIRDEFTSAAAKGDTIYFGTKGEGVARVVKGVDAYTGASAYLRPWSSLTGDSVTSIYIDTKGQQWYGTNNGISRHSNIEAKEGWDFSLTDQLPDKHVTTITGDVSGNIWIGTRGGLVKLGSDLKTINTWTVDDGLPSNVINTLFVDNDYSVWIGTDNGASHFNGTGFSNIKTSDYTRDFINF